MNQTHEAAILRLLTDVCGTDEIADERDLDLFEAGLLDSLAFIELLVGLEDHFGITVAPTEVDRDEVSTVNQILHFVEERL